MVDLREAPSWYVRKRAESLGRRGLLGAFWNPDLHPRGRDGKFIEKWGWVRWLVDGKWERGRVESILPEGKIIVRPRTKTGWSYTINKDKGDLFSLPSPKGTIMDGPDPTAEEVPEGWEKTGGQAGSNPAAFYTTTTQQGIERSFDPIQLESSAIKAGLTEADADAPMPEAFVASYLGHNDVGQAVFVPNSEAFGQGAWNNLQNKTNLKIFTGTPSDVTQLEKQLGASIEPGTRFYVKRTKTEMHAANEVLANELYKLAGVPMPDLYFGDHQTVVSKIVVSEMGEGGGIQSLNSVLDDPEMLAEIRKNFAIDAWLANWDTAGMTYDNMIIVDGVPIRIDTGGSLLYRAKGGEKGGAFGPTVGEITSLLDSGLNPSSSKVFSMITNAEVKEGITRIAAISPKQIRDMTEAVGLSSTLGNIIAARRKFLMEQYGVPDPFEVYQPPVLKSNAADVPEEKFWNPITAKWQTGVIKETASDIFSGQIEPAIKALPHNADVATTVGDLIRVDHEGEDIPRFGLFRVTDVDDNYAYGKSALNPDDDTIYTIPEYDVIADSEVPEELQTAMLRYRVAEANQYLSAGSALFLVTNSIASQDTNNHPITHRPRTKAVVGDDLWKVPVGDFVFHEYEDPEDPGKTHREIFQVKGSTESQVSLRNVVDGKERQITWNDWVDEEEKSNWHIPDAGTQNLTKGLLLRDKTLVNEDTDVTEIEIEEQEQPEITTANPASTAFNTTPVDLETMGVLPMMFNEDGVNIGLQVGESKGLNEEMWAEWNATLLLELEAEGKNPNISEMENGEFKSPYMDQWLGKSVILSIPPGGKSPQGSMDYRGLWHVVGVTNKKSTSYGGDAHVTSTLTFRSPSGTAASIVVKDPSGYYGGLGDLRIQEALTMDASVPQAPAVMGPSGDIVSEGVVVGQWEKGKQKWGYYGYKDTFQAKIFPQFALNGKAETYSDDTKYVLKEIIGRKFIPQLQPETVPKSEATKGSKEAILTKAVFKTRADFPADSWVLAPNGIKYRVMESDEEKYLFSNPSWLKVEDSTGKVRLINANVVVAAGSPDAADPDVDTTKVDAVPDGPPPFYPLKYGDGNDPRIGQTVTAGVHKAKAVTGKIVWVSPPGGKQAMKAPLATIGSEDGKLHRKTLSGIVLVEDIEGLPVDAPAAAVEIIEGDFTDSQIQDSAIQYIASDGHTINQAQYVKDIWLSGSPKRKLTKDGYAPQVGMRMKGNDGEPYVVTEIGNVYKNPNQVRVYNLNTGESGLKIVSTLWVDHAAELGDIGAGPTVQLVKGISNSTEDINLPDGTTIYRVKSAGYSHSSGRHFDQFFYITESQKVHVIGTSGAMSQDQTEYFLSRHWGAGDVTKEAVIDSTSDQIGALAQAQSAIGETQFQPAAFVPYNPAEFSHEEALSGYYVSLTTTAVPGTETSTPILAQFLIDLPKPAEIEVNTGETEPDPPVLSGTVGEITKTPAGFAGSPVRSIMDTARLQLKEGSDGTAGSGVEYGFGDSQYIEDMLVTTQIAKEQKTGQEYLELSFTMQEEFAEGTAEKLLTAGKSVTYGKWLPKADKSYPSGLKQGDTMQVRTSSVSGLLKPSQGMIPNVRLVEDAYLLGTDAKGVKIYRAKVANADGITGEVDLEERAMPSISTFVYDPNAVVQTGSSVSVSLTNKAKDAGWVDTGGIGFDVATTQPADKITVNSLGQKMFDFDKTYGVGARGGGVAKAEQGRRLRRMFPDGSHVLINAVHPGVSGTQQGSGSGTGEIRRWNEAGMVTIRVPREVTEDDAAFQGAISQAMEAIGIPAENQGPPSDEQIAQWVLNHLYKSYAPQFKHREQGVQQPDVNDPGVGTFMNRLNTELQQFLGRPVTFDDFQIRVGDNGDFKVVVKNEVARAITANQANRYFTHSISSGYTFDRIVSILASPKNGLLGATDRSTLGIFTMGQSGQIDATKGAGNRVYIRGMAGGASQSFSAHTFVLSPDAINAIVDQYGASHDAWGVRNPNNHHISLHSGTEYLIKNRLDLSQMAYYVAGGASDRQKLIDALLEKGVKDINGRPVEQFIITTSDYIDVGSDDFRNLGTGGAFIDFPKLLKNYKPPVVPTEPGEETEIESVEAIF